MLKSGQTGGWTPHRQNQNWQSRELGSLWSLKFPTPRSSQQDSSRQSGGGHAAGAEPRRRQYAAGGPEHEETAASDAHLVLRELLDLLLRLLNMHEVKLAMQLLSNLIAQPISASRLSSTGEDLRSSLAQFLQCHQGPLGVSEGLAEVRRLSEHPSKKHRSDALRVDRSTDDQANDSDDELLDVAAVSCETAAPRRSRSLGEAAALPKGAADFPVDASAKSSSSRASARIVPEPPSPHRCEKAKTEGWAVGVRTASLTVEEQNPWRFTRVNRASQQAALVCRWCAGADLWAKVRPAPYDEKLAGVPSHRCIIHPNGAGRMRWDAAVLLMIAAEALLVPLSVGLEISAPALFSILATLFFLVDIVLNCLTGFFKEGLLNMQQWPILLHYGRTWLLLDLVSTFPWFIWSDGLEDVSMLRFTKAGKFIRIVKLVRVAKLNALLTSFEEYFESAHVIITLKLAKALAIIFVLTHWIACMWAWIGHPDRYRGSSRAHDLAQCEPGGPCEPGIMGTPWLRRYGLESDTPFTKYLISLRFATGLFTGSDFGIQPGYWIERVFVVITMFSSFILLSTLLSKIVLMFNKINQEHMDQEELMMQFKAFMRSGKVPFQLQAKVRRYLEFQYKARRELQARRFEMLDRLSPWLRKELTVHLNRKVLELHPLFEDMPEQVLPHVCCNAASQLCAPGDIVMQSGQNVNFMLFLVRGKLSLVGPEADYASVLSRGNRRMSGVGLAVRKGDSDGMPPASPAQVPAPMQTSTLVAPAFIGTEALFHEETASPCTVSCQTHCELLHLMRDQILELQHEFPAWREHMRQYESVTYRSTK